MPVEEKFISVYDYYGARAAICEKSIKFCGSIKQINVMTLTFHNLMCSPFLNTVRKNNKIKTKRHTQGTLNRTKRNR